jgi:hypothetical protein
MSGWIAIIIIFGFVAAVGALNWFEFGSVD